MEYLDDGVLVEILVRLPAKSLLRCKCVDRRWNSLISDPRFVKAQARWSASDTSQHRLIMKRDNGGAIFVSFEDLMNGGWREDSAIRSDDRILGSCHGLLLLHRGFLCNPATNARKELPEPPVTPQFKFVLGFGYDVLNHDYKVVFANRYDYGFDVYVLSSRSNSWKSIGALRINIQDYQGKYSSGFLHWLRTAGGGILSFDIETEQLHIDLLPKPHFVDPALAYTRLGVTECGWLVLYGNSGTALEFWIMKDACRGLNSTWTKLCYFTSEQVKYNISYTTWFPWVRNGKVLLFTVLGKKKDRIGVYDPEGKCFKTVQVPENHCPLYRGASLPNALPHVFNLVVPPHV